MYIVLKILQIFLCRHSVDRSHGDFEMIKYISDMSRCIWQRAKKKPPHARLYALLLLYSRQKKTSLARLPFIGVLLFYRQQGF